MPEKPGSCGGRAFAHNLSIEKRIKTFYLLILLDNRIFRAHPAAPGLRPSAPGPGFTLVSFLPPAKKDTASIPCAFRGREFIAVFTAKS
ncbi:MAG: hypothetical protein LBK05_09275, partial [Treponema sp.]|nr:hypothetical protein [Treponema sp.]